MAFSILINGVDFSTYVYSNQQQLNYTLPINKPQTLKFALASSNGLFDGLVPPTREDKVILHTDTYGDNTFIGFISQFPQLKLLGYDPDLQKPVFGYAITCASEEFQLNAKSAQLLLLPTLTGRRSGSIIRIMTEFLLPGYFAYDFDDTAGNYQADFSISSGDVWSDIVSKLAVADRSRYWVRERTIYYRPFDDSPLGCSYDIESDPIVTGWNVSNMDVSPNANPIKNDIIVVGGDSPRGAGKAFFIGDGYQGNFYSNMSAFGMDPFTVLNETWQGAFNPNVWERFGDGWVDGLNNLQIAGGAGVSVSFIRLLKALELSGSLLLVHGEVQFSGISEALIGCLYPDFSLPEETNVLAGFKLTGGLRYAGMITINPSVNVLPGDVVTVKGYDYSFFKKLPDPSLPNQVLIGLNPASSLANLAAAIDAAPGNASHIYGVGTIASDVDAAYFSEFVLEVSIPNVTFALSSTSAAITCSGVVPSPQTLIEPLVSGFVPADSKSVISADNHSYVLITRLHTREIFPWRSIYQAPTTLAALFGGFNKSSLALVSFEVWDYRITGDASSAPTTIIPQKTVLATLTVDFGLEAPFVSYCALQATAATLAINFTQLTYPMQALVASRKMIVDNDTLVRTTGDPSYYDLIPRPVGVGIDQADATITSDSTGNILQFYPDPPSNIPQPGEIIEFYFRQNGRAVGRVTDYVNAADIATKYGVPDDGIRTDIISNYLPIVRTDEDARNAAAAILTDSIHPQYQVTYKIHSNYTTKLPLPGRFLKVNEARFENATADNPIPLLVSEVSIDIFGDFLTARSSCFITLKCGTLLNADVLSSLLARKGPSLSMADVAEVKPIDILSLSSAFLPLDIQDWGAEPFGEHQYQVGGFANPGYFVEVRKWDRGWGNDDSGLIIRADPGTTDFKIPRTSRNQTFFMRFMDASFVFSAQSAYCKISWPLVPPWFQAVSAFRKASDPYVLLLSFSVPYTNYQDVWRILVKGNYADIPTLGTPADNTVYYNLLWDGTTFDFIDVPLTRTVAQGPWVLPAYISLEPTNLLGESKVHVVKATDEKGEAAQTDVTANFLLVKATTGDNTTLQNVVVAGAVEDITAMVTDTPVDVDLVVDVFQNGVSILGPTKFTVPIGQTAVMTRVLFADGFTSVAVGDELYAHVIAGDLKATVLFVLRWKGIVAA